VKVYLGLFVVVSLSLDFPGKILDPTNVGFIVRERMIQMPLYCVL
jgi:hypothetical protein